MVAILGIEDSAPDAMDVHPRPASVVVSVCKSSLCSSQQSVKSWRWCKQFRGLACFAGIVQCKLRVKLTAVSTTETARWEPYPTSVSANVNEFRRPWLIYGEKVKRPATYLPDSTNILTKSLLLMEWYSNRQQE